jgi:uncharacterized protein with ATP-grasp and redox domains
MPKDFPPPIYSNQPGSWANSTVVKRWPNTARKVLKDNEYPSQIRKKLKQLIDDIPHQPVRHLEDKESPDWGDWSSYIAPWVGKGWLEIPWFFGEHYFYRRIIEAVDYFKSGLDPFAKEKRFGLENTTQDIQIYVDYLDRLERDRGVEIFRGVLYSSLWGNQADLSLWPSGSTDNPKHLSQESLKAHLLGDDSNQVIREIKKFKPGENRLDIILDNAGFELISDLGMADTFLRHGYSSQVVLHVKAHPTFVSDVIETDVPNAIDFLSDISDQPTRSLGTRLGSYVEDGRLEIQSHYFWNSPLAMWELPGELMEKLAQSALIINKGDANYRRLLGDLDWDFTLPFPQLVDYLPAPLAALRTLKAELAVGMDLEGIQETYNQDPDWLVDGKWGVIHFSPAAKKNWL